MITVFVWTTDQGSWNGHAAIQIASHNPRASTYVSFYPSRAAQADIAIDVVGSQFSSEPMPDKCYPPKVYTSYSKDLAENWDGKNPKLKVTIPGLNESKMKKAWGENVGRWCAVSKNCATVVATLLEIGSGVGSEEVSTFLKRFHERNKKRIYKKAKNTSLLNRVDNFFGLDLVDDYVTVRNQKFQWKKPQKYVEKQDDWSVDTFGKSAYSGMMTPTKAYNYSVGLKYLMEEKLKSKATGKKKRKR